MNKSILLLIGSVILLSTCKENEPTAPGEIDDPNILAEATIGSSGGELKTDALLLKIPPGALTNTETIKVLSLEDDEMFVDNKITPSFKIEGIPIDFSEELTLELRYSKDPTNESCIAIGRFEYIEEIDDNRKIFDLIDAADKEGFLVGTITPLTNPDPLLKQNDEIPPIKYVELFGYGLLRVPTYTNETVRIKYEPGLSDSKIVLIGDYFNEAINYLSNQKIFDKVVFGENKDRRIKINIVDDKSTKQHYDYYSPEGFDGVENLNSFEMLEEFENSINKFSITMNVAMLNSATDDELSAFAAEGAYRFVRLIMLGSKMNWFDWATIGWLRRQFSLSVLAWDAKYANNPILLASFEGMEYGVKLINEIIALLVDRDLKGGYVTHGIGMAPLIDFLMKNYNPDGELLYQIYNEIIKYNNHLPTDFLLRTIQTPENIWWPQFVEEYLLRYVYNIPPQSFIEKIPQEDEITFLNTSDTLKYFDKSYPDLSAKLCKISVPDDLKDNSLLNLQLGPSSLNLDYVKLLVFGLENDNLVLVNKGIEFSISDIEKYSTLVACVVNSGNEEPYLGKLDIDLEIRLKVSKYPYLNIVLRNIGTMVESYSPYYERYDTSSWNLTFSSQPYEMTKIGNEYVGLKDKFYDWGVNGITHEIGKIIVSMDENSKSIINFWIDHKMIGNDDIDTSIHKAEGNNIPFYWQSETSLQQYLDHDVYARLKTFEWYSSQKTGSQESNYRTIKIVPNDVASIEFYWSNELP